MTGPSGEPYQVGDDTVAARLEVDIPADAVNSLTDLSRLTADIRANMEATAKYNQDYVTYLRELPNAIGEATSAHGQLSDAQSSIFGGGAGSPSDPFAGRNAGAGAPLGGQAGAGRPMRAVDQDALVNLAQNNPRQVANMAADRGLDDYIEDGSHTLPRPPERQAGSGREMQGSRSSSSPRGSRSSSESRTAPSGTGPGNASDNSAGTGTGRQVGSQSTESAAERAATRLLAELDRGNQGDSRNLGQAARGVGDGIQNNSLLNFLNQEGGTRGRTDALGFAGGLGRMAQSSAEGAIGRVDAAEAQRQTLLTQANEVAATNPTLAAELQARAAGMAPSAGMARAMPILKGAGAVGAGVAAIAGVNAAVQNTGETLHGIQGQGVQAGGGMVEGMAFEAQIRTMAMNPFISTEQSRKIMQSALQTGYSGKEMDTMTEFMAENLKNMNIEVAESTKLLQQNVLKGGQSTESVQAQLSQNVAMAGVTNMSADQINQQYAKLSGGFIDAGAAGAPAGAAAQSMSTVFESNDVLKTGGPDTLNRMMMNDVTTQGFLSRSIGADDKGVPLTSVGQYAVDNLKSGELTMEVIEATGKRLETWIKMYATGDEGKKYRAATQAAKILGVNENEAHEWLRLYVTGEIFDMVEKNEENWESNGGGKMDVTQKDLSITSDIKTAKSVVQDAGSYIRAGWNTLTGDRDQAEEVLGNKDKRHEKQRLESQLRPTFGGPTYSPEVLQQLALEEHGGSLHDVSIIENGKERKISQADLQNKQLMEKLQKGDVKVKTEAGGEQTLREWGNTSNTAADGSKGGATHEIKMSDETRRFFGLTSTPNQTQKRADRGQGARNEGDPGTHGPQKGPGG